MTVERAKLAAEIEHRAHLKGTFRLRSGRVADDYFLQRNGLALHALFTFHDLTAAQRADP